MMILVLGTFFSISFIAAFFVFNEAQSNDRKSKLRNKGVSLKKQPLDQNNSKLCQAHQVPLMHNSERIGVQPSLSVNSVAWDTKFLKKLEWKLFEDICMEYLKIKNCDADVTCYGADGGIDIISTIRMARKWL